MQYVAVSSVFTMIVNSFVNILLLLLYCDISNANSKLLSVVQVFRHGERTPLVFYPTDPYKDPKYWNGLGTGQLTEQGKQQLYKLGQYFRNRYGSFVMHDYLDTQISVRSSNTERNLASAKSFLNGLYGNVEIPISIVNKPILSSLVTCLKFDVEYLKAVVQHEEFSEVNNNNRELYDYLSKHTKMPIFGLGTTFLVWDTLNVESKVHFQLPEWTKQIWPEPMMQISKNFSRLVCQDKKQQKLAGGAFLNQLMEHFENILEGSEEEQIILYSGHDINLICFLSIFEYYKYADPDFPTFASSIIFELRQHEKSKIYFINTFYKPSVEATEIPLRVRGCAVDCEFQNFKNILSDFRLTEIDWYKKCYFFGKV